MDSSYWNALITRQDTQLEFIAAPEKLSERTTPDPRQLGRLLRFIRSIYPVAILDFGRCYSAGALEALPEMEALYLLTTQDIHALENAKDFIAMAESRGRGTERIQVVLNKVSPRQKPDLDGLETYLGLRPSGVFSDDTEALYETWSEGQLLSGSSVLGRQLMALAKTIMTPAAVTGVGESAAEGSGQKPTAPAAMGLGRLFSFMRSSRA
jgi:Flp pilus assembly CpaE family ATPase